MIITYKSSDRLLTILCLCLLAQTIKAQPKLGALFTDNLVLQQQSKVQIWGWDKPSTTITLTETWSKAVYKAAAAADGKFIFKIATPIFGGPYQITVTDGKAITLNNILIGEVWLCAGQSNMEMPMKGFKGQPIYNPTEAILSSKNKNIRLYTVPRASVIDKQTDSKPSQWKEADPESVSNFSATGYYFGRLINKVLDNVPVGLIHCSYSGSSIQAWMDAQTLGAFPTIKIPAKGDTIKQVSRTPTTLYNGMLYPILGYGIKGAIWYQGESNYDDPSLYDGLFQTFVTTLRKQWGEGDFPFYYCQIAPYDYAQLPPYNKGGKYNSAFTRDVQRLAADKIPNTAMAVLMDIGEQQTIHPQHKETGGTRMAYLALGKTYGIKGFTATSPTYDSQTIKNDQIVVKFKDCPMGITSYFKELTQFEIAGEERHFYPAKAVISGSTVTVSAPQVKKPVAVRYAFRDFTVGELFSTDGLPASSFRTDDWEYDAK